MSTAVMSSPMFECGELFKSPSAAKGKEPTSPGVLMPGNRHAPLRRSYTSLVSLIEQHRKLDRSVSEPTSRYKTELCRPFEESGGCKYGDKCQFAHGHGELRNLARHPKYKTEPCRTFHKNGFCPYGPRCHFVHNLEEARVQSPKLPTSPQPGLVGLGPLLQPATAAALTVNVGLLEQLAASPQVAVALQNSPLVRANSLSSAPVYHQPLHRSASLQQPPPPSNSILIGASARPKPLNLSPTFSLGSQADSISPSSSLSQSPTNSMASFFSDEPIVPAFNFCQELGLIRQSPSPQAEMAPRTPSPLSPNGESRLPVFNRISNTLADFENLKL